ncbi:RraA family protein [Bacillus mesophilum]|uniref:Putative 4-hydroxy-4-methyl-2-oxoglutarate aldolase n=1 Tax=Bacillus mesophilum TaxID=1071718 RepID=A0A7V7RQM9_9BACI|nr:RraA family protein [Bacillus mesophilum]KAB2335776.1 RraA family protein [Bacillus mesophilum]
MDNIISKFLKIPTACFSDSMQGLNNMDSTIKPLKEDFVVAGRAFTVKIPVGDNKAVLRAINEANPGDVLVIDAKGDTYRAIAGDFIVGLAQSLGINGIIADGVIRDVQGVKKLNYPVFCKGTTVAASAKSGWGEMNIPISCGGVAVKPGDIVVGDADGVVIIPQEREKEILKLAQEKLRKDEEREAQISGNHEEIRRFLNQMTK